MKDRPVIRIKSASFVFRFKYKSWLRMAKPKRHNICLAHNLRYTFYLLFCLHKIGCNIIGSSHVSLHKMDYWLGSSVLSTWSTERNAGKLPDLRQTKNMYSSKRSINSRHRIWLKVKCLNKHMKSNWARRWLYKWRVFLSRYTSNDDRWHRVCEYVKFDQHTFIQPLAHVSIYGSLRHDWRCWC